MEVPAAAAALRGPLTLEVVIVSLLFLPGAFIAPLSVLLLEYLACPMVYTTYNQYNQHIRY